MRDLLLPKITCNTKLHQFKAPKGKKTKIFGAAKKPGSFFLSGKKKLKSRDVATHNLVPRGGCCYLGVIMYQNFNGLPGELVSMGYMANSEEW